MTKRIVQRIYVSFFTLMLTSGLRSSLFEDSIWINFDTAQSSFNQEIKLYPQRQLLLDEELKRSEIENTNDLFFADLNKKKTRERLFDEEKKARREIFATEDLEYKDLLSKEASRRERANQLQRQNLEGNEYLMRKAILDEENTSFQGTNILRLAEKEMIDRKLHSIPLINTELTTYLSEEIDQRQKNLWDNFTTTGAPGTNDLTRDKDNFILSYTTEHDTETIDGKTQIKSWTTLALGAARLKEITKTSKYDKDIMNEIRNPHPPTSAEIQSSGRIELPDTIKRIEESTKDVYTNTKYFPPRNHDIPVILPEIIYSSDIAIPNITRQSFSATPIFGQTPPSTNIHYNCFVKLGILKKNIKPKGVIILNYGAIDNPFPFNPNSKQSREKMWASQDYIIYVLNTRPLDIQGKSEGVLSLLRDIVFFAYLVRNSDKCDDLNQKPLTSIISDLYHSQDPIVKADMPIFFTGESFGGYQAMLLGTWKDKPQQRYQITRGGLTDQKIINDGNDGKIIFRNYSKNNPIFPYETFDGLIPAVPYEIFRDGVSLTNAGISRKAGSIAIKNKQNFDPPSGSGWMLQTSANSDPNTYIPRNQINNLKIPMFLMHGIKDNNTPTSTSFDAAQAAAQIKSQLISQYYYSYSIRSQPTEVHGHHYPKQNEYKYYYEAMFRFMDAVRFFKEKGQIFNTNPITESILTNAAWFRQLATHPSPLMRRPHFEYWLENLLAKKDDPKDVFKKPQPRTINSTEPIQNFVQKDFPTFEGNAYFRAVKFGILVKKTFPDSWTDLLSNFETFELLGINENNVVTENIYAKKIKILRDFNSNEENYNPQTLDDSNDGKEVAAFLVEIAGKIKLLKLQKNYSSIKAEDKKWWAIAHFGIDKEFLSPELQKKGGPLVGDLISSEIKD